MRWKLMIFSLVFAALAACERAPPSVKGAEWIEPSNAVQLAAASPQDGVTGVFYMTVKAAEQSRRILHLNSELDYRDQRNLSVAVGPQATEELTKLLDASPELALKDKRILVIGTAKRAKIIFTEGGKSTDKYYYQTHVSVTKASQIKVL